MVMELYVLLQRAPNIFLGITNRFVEIFNNTTYGVSRSPLEC